jgi:uncharacterized protein (DUF302 family)
VATRSMSSYTLGVTTSLPFAQVVERVRSALAAEGFGVLTEIDVQRTLREKLGAETDPYLILGACNPPFAQRALEAEPLIGTLLPCNVVVRDVGGSTAIDAIDPEAMLQIAGNPALLPLALEVRERLWRALAASVEG